MKKLKILLYDIESTPNLGYVWGKYDQTVLSYAKERELLTFGYKWLREKKVHCLTRQNEKTDKKLIKKAASLLEEADICIAHNGDSFDRLIVKTRMVYWGMKPLKMNCSVDTRRVAKRYFSFNGNSLDDLAKFLRVGSKLATPGINLWLGCMKNDPESWRTMIKYNKNDIHPLLEGVYNKLRPWIEDHPNVSRLLRHREVYGKGCPNCGKQNLIKRGLRATMKYLHQDWECKDCGRRFVKAIRALNED